MTLRVEGLTVDYGETRAVEEVGFEVGAREVVALIGPSGSGKTSVLRAIAGLEEPTAGRLHWDGEDLRAVAPHRRDFSLMFQDHALFASKSVAGNIEFGLLMRGTGRAARATRVGELLELVGLPDVGSRGVHELSGGEQQRVALARALAPSPRLLMLDEPLASVDRERRDQLSRDLHHIIHTTGVPTLLVTHDLDEAFTLADRVIVLERGRVLDAGPSERVWRAPATPAVARFLGVVNELELPVVGGQAMTPWGPIGGLGNATAVWVGWRPADLRTDPTGPVAGTVTATWFRRDHYAVEVTTDHGVFVAAAVDRPAAGAAITLGTTLDTAVVIAA